MHSQRLTLSHQLGRLTGYSPIVIYFTTNKSESCIGAVCFLYRTGARPAQAFRINATRDVGVPRGMRRYVHVKIILRLVRRPLEFHSIDWPDNAMTARHQKIIVTGA